MKDVEVGDAVWGALSISSTGSLCEFIVIDQRSVRLKPHLLGHDGSATIPYSGLMVYGMDPRSFFSHMIFQL